MNVFIYTLKENICYIFKSILLFLFIYELNFAVFGLPTFITSRRVIAIFLLIYIIFKFGSIKLSTLKHVKSYKSVKNVVLISFIILVYSFILIFLDGKGSGIHISDCIIRLIIFGILPIFLFYNIFKTVNEFWLCILVATIFQSCFIFASLINPSFGVYLDTTFAYNLDYASTMRGAYAGGLACVTAPGCLKFSLGLIACLYFILKSNKIIFYFIYLLLAFISTMIARIGLFISIIGLIIIFLSNTKSIFNRFKTLLYLLIAIIVGIILFNNTNLGNIFNFYRLQNLFENGINDEFLSGYFAAKDTSFPSLLNGGLLGTGLISGITAKGIVVNVDGGYLRVYSAIGIIFSLIFYYILFKSLFKSIPREKNIYRSISIFFFILIAIGEFKEFTVFDQYMICLFFTSILLISKKYL